MGMESSKVTSKGQITIPKTIREKLNLTEGDHVLFIDEGNGRVIMTKSEIYAVRQFFDTMVAESRAKYYTEDELQAELKRARKEILDERNPS